METSNILMTGKRKPSTLQFLCQEISIINTDFLLLFISYGTGIIDAFTFVQLEVFAANQTGNTVFLALSAAQVQYSFLDARRSIVALTSFWAGSFLSGQVGHIVGPRRRWWICLTLFIQGILTILASILLWSNTVSTDDLQTLSHKVLGLICILSLSYGAQATTARGLQVPEIPTVVVTSAMVDMFGDKNIFNLHNRPRNRRIAFVFILFLGAFTGGWILSRVNGALTICIAGVVKILSAACVLLYESKEEATERQSRLVGAGKS